MRCSFRHERALARRAVCPVAGIDEAGRGPLAGPVVAAAVVLPLDWDLPGIDDSKKLTPERREELHAALVSNPRVTWAVAVRDHLVIDRINILQATYEAMSEAFRLLEPLPVHVLIDGRTVPGFPCPQTALVGGDGECMSIAAASIIAKVVRDRMMDAFDREYPAYGFSQHKGYVTPGHLARLREHGPCPIHRRSFSPVAQPELF